ncbi:MAG: hypothetical protein IPK07_04300 [Deltaproteobacteria bacterium]|nr:hypothetical protein [Deltaproteobacteria bacterium]
MVCSILLAFATPVVADVFSYRDKDGKVHFVDQEAAIPQQYRTSESPGGASKRSVATPDGSGVLNTMPQGGGADSEAGADGGGASAGEGDAEFGLGGGQQAENGMVSCTLRYLEKPSKEIDVRYTTVTYRGEIENTGTGIARTARAHLKLFSVIDGSQVDEESSLLRPGDIAPGARATFEVKGNFRKTGLRNSSRDELMVDYVRCDQSSADVAASARGKGCELQIVGEPLKEIDPIRKTVTYSGTVQNQGQKVAKTVQVQLTSFNMRDGKPFPPVSGTTNPARVGPGQGAEFKLVAPLDFGFRDPKKDKFSVGAARCDDATEGSD